MFEYLMPALVMHSPAGSLLDQTCRLAVAPQIQYGREHGVPWGISESAYSVRDRDLRTSTRLRRAGAGLKRGLSEDLSSPLRYGAGRDDRRARGRRATSSGWRSRRAGAMASTKRSTTRGRVPEGEQSARRCAPTWPTTRA